MILTQFGVTDAEGVRNSDENFSVFGGVEAVDVVDVGVAVSRNGEVDEINFAVFRKFAKKTEKHKIENLRLKI
jgi:hypothetical protein